jgi:hypothetical protein
LAGIVIHLIRRRSLSVAGALLLVAMIFATVYLNHHYVVGGFIYALVTFALIEGARA